MLNGSLFINTTNLQKYSNATFIVITIFLLKYSGTLEYCSHNLGKFILPLCTPMLSKILDEELRRPCLTEDFLKNPVKISNS